MGVMWGGEGVVTLGSRWNRCRRRAHVLVEAVVAVVVVAAMMMEMMVKEMMATACILLPLRTILLRQGARK